MLHPAPFSVPATGLSPDPGDVAPPDPREAVISRAERQLVMLDRVAELSMGLAEALQRRAVAEALNQARVLEKAPGDGFEEVVVEPANRPLNKEPGETFVRVTRALRLTFAMQMNLEKAIQALREGKAAEVKAAAGPAANDHDTGGAKWRPGQPVPQHHSRVNDGSRADKVRDLVWDVINHDINDVLKSHETLSALHERLKETETYDEFLFRPLKETVEAICADLGLKPDWSRWTGEGWAPPTSRYQWQSFWGPNIRTSRPDPVRPGAPAPAPHRRLE